MELRRVCVRGIIEQNGKIYAQKLKNTDGSAKNFWCTPGGGLDPMESLHDGLRREMIEETGVAPQIGRLLLIQQFATNGQTNHGDNEQLEFFFLIENADDYQNIDLSATSHGEAEIAEHGFIDPLAENVLPSVLTTAAFAEALANKDSKTLIYTEGL